MEVLYLLFYVSSDTRFPAEVISRYQNGYKSSQVYLDILLSRIIPPSSKHQIYDSRVQVLSMVTRPTSIYSLGRRFISANQ